MANSNLVPIYEPMISGATGARRTRDRVQTQDLNLTPQLNPQQAPVDTYVYPGRPTAGRDRGALADALQALEPALAQYGADQTKKFDAREFAEGEQAYLKNKAKLKDAVNKGLIPAGYSPAFKRGYEQSELRVSGLSYDQALRQAYQKSGLENSDDPNALAQFTSEFTANYLKDKTAGYDALDVEKVLMPVIEGSQANLSQYHSARRAQLIEQGHFANTEVEIAQTIDNMLSRDGDTDHSVIGSVLTDQLNKALENGGDAKQYNQMLVDQVVAKAEERGDTSILDVLDHINTGPGGTLGKTTYAKEHRVAAESSITSHQMQMEAYNERQREKAKQDQADAILNKVIQTVTANPAADVRQYMNALGTLAPEKAASALSLQQAMLSAQTRVIEDPAQKAVIYANIDAASSKEEQNAIIVAAAQDGMIDSNSVGELHRYGDDQLKLKPTTEQPWYRELQDSIFRQLSMRDRDDLPLPEVPVYQEAARRRLKQLTKLWIKQNADASGKFDNDELELYLQGESDKFVQTFRQRMLDESYGPTTPNAGSSATKVAPPAHSDPGLIDSVKSWFGGGAENPFDETQKKK